MTRPLPKVQSLCAKKCICTRSSNSTTNCTNTYDPVASANFITVWGSSPPTQEGNSATWHREIRGNSGKFEEIRTLGDNGDVRFTKENHTRPGKFSATDTLSYNTNKGHRSRSQPSHTALEIYQPLFISYQPLFISLCSRKG